MVQADQQKWNWSQQANNESLHTTEYTQNQFYGTV
jgi:hypothetical protein